MSIGLDLGFGFESGVLKFTQPHLRSTTLRQSRQRQTLDRSQDLDGKATSCLNAVKTGLTGRTVLLHTDDAAEYERHVAAYAKEFSPVGPRECDLVQSIADTQWRLARIPALEMAIYAQGRAQFAGEFKDHDAALQPGLIELKTFMSYERQLRNLQIQESRLARRREKEIAELRELQKTRRADEAKNVGQALSPVDGFEFSSGADDREASSAKLFQRDLGHASGADDRGASSARLAPPNLIEAA